MDGTSKYTAYFIKSIKSELVMNTTYDDDIEVGYFSPFLSKVFITGKYTKVNIGIDPAAEYYLEFDTKYTNIDIEKKLYEEIRYHKDNDVLQATYKTKGMGDNEDSKVKIDMYDGRIILD